MEGEPCPLCETERDPGSGICPACLYVGLLAVFALHISLVSVADKSARAERPHVPPGLVLTR
jgi:disulfide bond formation protein DsbB